MITADTITDEQCAAARLAVMNDPSCDEVDRHEICLIEHWATSTNGHVQRHAARARCAEILNARATLTCPDACTKGCIRVPCMKSYAP